MVLPVVEFKNRLTDIIIPQVTDVAREQMEKAIRQDYTGVENNVATETIDKVQEEVS